MKKILFILIPLVITVVPAATVLYIITANKIPDNAPVVFTAISNAKKMKGCFTDLSSDSRINMNNLTTSTINYKIAVSSINTGKSGINSMVQDNSWFDASRHPFISFQSVKIEKTTAGYHAIGYLTLKGRTVPVSMPFSVEQSTTDSYIIKGTLSINPTTYGIGPNKVYPRVVAISLDIPATKVAA
jgi:polyisoprenoid-binding protein YceI